MDGELRFEPSSLRLPTLPFQLTELLRNTAEPGRRLPCTDCATAETISWQVVLSSCIVQETVNDCSQIRAAPWADSLREVITDTRDVRALMDDGKEKRGNKNQYRPLATGVENPRPVGIVLTAFFVCSSYPTGLKTGLVSWRRLPVSSGVHWTRSA